MTTPNILTPFPLSGIGGATTPPIPGDGTCRSCGQGLIRMQGFAHSWPLVCNNWQCQLDRERQGMIPKPEPKDAPLPWHIKYREAYLEQKEREKENYHALIAVGVPSERAIHMKSDRRTKEYLQHHYSKTRKE